MGQTASSPLSHDLELISPFGEFKKMTLDTSGAILHEFQFRGYDYAIEAEAVSYLVGQDLETAEKIIAAFDKNNTQVINSLSLITAIIAVSNASSEKSELDAKLGLIFDSFDFSHKGSISMDEMVILLHSVLTGLLCMSGAPSDIVIKDTDMEKLVVDAYKMAKKPLHRKLRKKQVKSLFCNKCPAVYFSFAHVSSQLFPFRSPSLVHF